MFRPYVNFTNKFITFSSACFDKLQTAYIELLINPTTKMFAVRASDSKTCRNAVKWYKFTQNIKSPRPINGSAFLPILYDIMKWNLNNKYQVIGDIKTKGSESLIFFYLKETKIIISKDSPVIELEKIPKNTKPFTNGPKKNIVAYPKEWRNYFGRHYYERQAKELQLLGATENWESNSDGVTYEDFKITNTTQEEDINQQIESIKTEMKEAVKDDGE